MDKSWIDFRVVKAAVTMQMIVDHYGLVLKRSGQELRGKCPIHRGSNNKHFTVNLSKNVFKCFFESCGAHGNVLDFVAAIEHCPVREAAVKLRDWFRVGDSGESKQARQEEIEIKKGIYSDDQGAIYEVIGIASHAEGSGLFVVYRELFDDYRLVVITREGFSKNSKTSGQPHFTLVKEL